MPLRTSWRHVRGDISSTQVLFLVWNQICKVLKLPHLLANDFEFYIKSLGENTQKLMYCSTCVSSSVLLPPATNGGESHGLEFLLISQSQAVLHRLVQHLLTLVGAPARTVTVDDVLSRQTKAGGQHSWGMERREDEEGLVRWEGKRKYSYTLNRRDSLGCDEYLISITNPFF